MESLNTLLFSGMMSTELRNIIVEAVESLPGDELEHRAQPPCPCGHLRRVRGAEISERLMANNVPRRKFLRQAACSAVGTSALVSTIMDLYAVNAAAQSASDYKALVCMFLFGGNDSSNMLVPRAGGDYAGYAAACAARSRCPGASSCRSRRRCRDGIDLGLHP